MMRALAYLVVLVGLSLAGGCVTDADSDMPWNTPQSWEGAPGIPGLSAPGR